MARQRSLLRTVSVSTAGRRHSCRSDDSHVLLKGDTMLVVKVDRDKFHYCTQCALLFIDTARRTLTALAEQLGESSAPRS